MEKYLFLLGLYIYWAFTGITEAIGTSDNPHLYTDKQQDEYHILRTLEIMGALSLVVIISIAIKQPIWIWRTLIGSASGIGLYEMFFCWEKYGNFIYNKKSHWLFIKKRPPGWFWIPVFIGFFILYWRII